MVRASRPSTAASAAIMNAANRPGSRSSLPRASRRMASNASKPAARRPGRLDASRRSLMDARGMLQRILRRHFLPGETGSRAAGLPGRGSRGPPVGQPDRLGDLVQVIIGEVVSVAA